MPSASPWGKPGAPAAADPQHPPTLPQWVLGGETRRGHSVLWENWKSRSADGKIHFRFYGPHSCISSYLEKHQNPSMMTGESVTSGDLPETSGGVGWGEPCVKCVPCCGHRPRPLRLRSRFPLSSAGQEFSEVDERCHRPREKSHAQGWAREPGGKDTKTTPPPPSR